jgi:hypothetical protein
MGGGGFGRKIRKEGLWEERYDFPFMNLYKIEKMI